MVTDLDFETPDFPGRPWRIHDLTKQTSASERPKSFFTLVNPKTGKEVYPLLLQNLMSLLSFLEFI